MKKALFKSLFFIFSFLLLFSPRILCSSETFSIQAGAFSSEKNAQKLVKDLQERGIICVSINEGLYKVYCGTFSKKYFADAFKTTLSALGYKNTFIVSKTVLLSQKPFSENIPVENSLQSSSPAPSKKEPPDKYQEFTQGKKQKDAVQTSGANPETFPEKPLYNLQDCLALALKNNPLILSADAERLSANSHLKYRRALFNPTLDFSAKLGFITGSSISPFALDKDSDEEGNRVRNISVPYYNLGPEFQYPIFREGVFFGKDAPTIKKAEAQAGAANKNQTMVQNEIFYRIVEAYIEALKLKEDIAVQREEIKYLQFNYEMVTSKHNLTLLTKDELLKTESELLKAETTLENILNNFEQKKIDLAYWMGIDPLSKFEIADTLNETFFASVPVSNLKTLVAIAHQKNPQILRQTYKIEALKEEVSFHEKKKYPDIDLSASLGVADDFDMNPHGLFNVFFQLRLPIFDFDRIKSQVEKARYKLQKEVMTLLDMKNRIAKETAQIITNIRNLENLISSEKKAIESAQEFNNLMQESFTRKMVTLSSVLKAQFKLLSTKTALNQLNYEYRLAHAKLMKTTGEIPFTNPQ